MKRFTLLASITTLLVFCTPAISNDKNENKQVKNKTQEKVETTGQVVIEINGVPQVIKLDNSPAELKKQLQNLADGMNNKVSNPNDTSKKQTSKSQSSSGKISYHTIIIGPDGVVKEEKVEKNIGGNAFNNKQLLKDLPEQVRKQVETAMKDAGKNALLKMKIEADELPGSMPNKKVDIMPLLKNAGADLPADIRKQLLKAMQGMDASGVEIGDIQARAIVIGPDGKKQEYNFGSETNNARNIKKSKVGEKTPASTTTTDKKVLDTLSKILERLEKVENELEALKKLK